MDREDDAPTFVECRAKSLTGRVVVVPRDLPEGRVLVLVGFSPAAQQDMDRWIACAAAQDLAVVEIPVIRSPLARPFAGVLARRMAARTPVEDHEHVLIVTDDADAVERWIGGRDPEHAYAVLLDADRRVVQSWAAAFPAEPFRLSTAVR